LEHLDGLVSSAGIARRATVVNTNSTDWDDVLRVNLRGSFLVSKYALPLMTAGGSIIHMASVAGITGLRNRAAYSASKGAVVALTRSMAIDYAKMGIRVNCLCPGFVRTPLTETLFSDEQRAAALTAIHPLGRLGEPDDIANAAFFLLSDDASWITGQAIAVDGGLSAGNSADI
jgi:meso-butanediol dehydrogenase / (S,S)-butanediol dehydrogenase / diacetyl reductase